MSKRRRSRPKVKNQLDNAVQPDKVLPQIATRESSAELIGSVFGYLPNPDPVLKKLGLDAQVYEELKSDSRVMSGMGQRKAAVSGMEWQIVGENQQSEIDFYTELFNQDHWNIKDKIEEILDSWWFGYKPNEIIWGRYGEMFAPVDFVGKPSSWFVYGEENELRYLSKSNPIYGEPVDNNRFVVSRNKPTYENPYGLPVASGCYWPAIFRKNGYQWWTMFMEKYGMPFLWGKAPEGAKEEKINEVANMLENMVQDAIAVTPSDYDLQLLESGGNNGRNDSAHKVFIDSNNTEISIVITGHNLTTEVQGGSFAAAQTGLTIRDDIIESDRRIVENTFNELISKTHAMNFTSPAPHFKLFSEEKIEKERAERDKLILDGNPSFSFTEKYYQDNYNLTEDDFIISGSGENDNNE